MQDMLTFLLRGRNGEAPIGEIGAFLPLFPGKRLDS